MYGHPEVVVRATSRGALAAAGGGKQWCYAVRSCRGHPAFSPPDGCWFAPHREEWRAVDGEWRGGMRPPQPPMSQTLRSLSVGKTACPRSPTQRVRSRSFVQRRETWRSGNCKPRISRTRRRARRPRTAACSLTAADTWRVAIQAGSDDGNDKNLIC